MLKGKEHRNFWRKRKSCGKDLSSWTATGQVLDSWTATGHAWIPVFHKISHASGVEISFWHKFQMILYGFAWRNPKDTLKQ